MPVDEEGNRNRQSLSRHSRIANNLVYFVRDYAEEKGDGSINSLMARKALELLEIDERGLDEMDKRILRTIAETHRGGPVGLSTIGVAVGEEINTLEEVHEPYLIQNGFCKGRLKAERLPRKAMEPLGKPCRQGPNKETFFSNSQFTSCNPANRASNSLT